MLGNSYRIRCVAALLSLFLAGAMHADVWRVTVNPYEQTDWENHAQHKGSFHNHTTESDGKQTPAEVIDAYHAIEHYILALTDHDKHTWPWHKFGRDPDELGMVAVPGNELSRHHHTLSLFSGLETETKDHATALRQVKEADGVSILAHPGRYWKLDEEGKVPDAVRDLYVGLFKKHDNLAGMEVVNQGDRYPQDRALWDAVLTELMPGRPVWGMANDDSHGQHQVGLNTTVMLLPSLDIEHVRAAFEEGRYYFTTVTSHPKEQQDRASTPVIRAVTYDPEANTLTVRAESAEKPVPNDRYRWISAGGKVVFEGPTLNLADTPNLSKYVRAEIRGDGGTAYTQPLGIEKEKTEVAKPADSPGPR